MVKEFTIVEDEQHFAIEDIKLDIILSTVVINRFRALGLHNGALVPAFEPVQSVKFARHLHGRAEVAVFGRSISTSFATTDWCGHFLAIYLGDDPAIQGG